MERSHWCQHGWCHNFYDVVLASNYLGQNMQCVFSNNTRVDNRLETNKEALHCNLHIPGQAQADSTELYISV